MKNDPLDEEGISAAGTAGGERMETPEDVGNVVRIGGQPAGCFSRARWGECLCWCEGSGLQFMHLPCAILIISGESR